MTHIFKALVACLFFSGLNSYASNLDFQRKLANPKTYKVDRTLSLTKSICGSNNLQHVALYDGSRGQPVEFVAKHESAVGALAYTENGKESKYCSGTLISEDLFLTAGHCVDVSTLFDKAVFNYQRLPNSTKLAQQEGFKILQIVESQLNGLDFAILKIDKKPGLKYGFRKINIQPVPNNHLLTIIQHPNGDPKMVDVGHNQGSKDQIYMNYNDLDTLPGSSGSGVLDEVGDVVGVHTNGGCGVDGFGANMGVMITEIVKASPTLKKLKK